MAFQSLSIVCGHASQSSAQRKIFEPIIESDLPIRGNNRRSCTISFDMGMENEKRLSRLGFNFEPGSTLTKRTIMSSDLLAVFEHVRNSNAELEEYRHAVVEDNCLNKRTQKNRGYSFSYLRRTYGLDSDQLIFRALRSYINRDPESAPLLCGLAAYARDSIIRASSGYVQALAVGSTPNKEDFENYIDRQFPGRFGEKMLQSLVRNLLSSWKQIGHLSTERVTERQVPKAGPGAVGFALLLGYLRGARGENLFRTEYSTILGCSVERQIELATEAGRRGWISFKRIGNVVDVSFPELIGEKEMEILREQG